MKNISSTQKSYLAGFLDGDGSIYVQAKPNKTYQYGFQIAPYIVLYQSEKNQKEFEKICLTIMLGYLRKRRDGIMEYIIGRQKNILEFIKWIEPYIILKKPQIMLIKKIINLKNNIKDRKDFKVLIKLVDEFRKINYSKKRKIRTLTP